MFTKKESYTLITLLSIPLILTVCFLGLLLSQKNVFSLSFPRGSGNLVGFQTQSLFNDLQDQKKISTPKVNATSVQAKVGNVPTSLLIPSLSINAAIQRVGVTSTGRMGTPTGKSKYKDVAWYKDGPKPGEAGSAVIAGHLDNGFGLSAVFAKLDSLAVGDDIFVSYDSGERVHFVVRNVSVYEDVATPVQEIFSKTGSSRLALITCDGDWDSDSMSYNKRLVVTAEKI